MRRREFLAIAGCAVFASPVRGAAQQSPKLPRIAVALSAGDAGQMIREDGLAAWPGFLKELRRLGYVEGTDIVIERYSAKGRRERFDEFVSDVVGRTPTLIVTAPNPFTILFMSKTNTIPIVAILADPIRYGMVTNLARPGGNLTGVSVDAGQEIWQKRLEIIKQAVPSASRVALLGVGLYQGPVMQSLNAAGERLGVTATMMSVTESTEQAYRELFAATRPFPDAILVIDSGEVTPHRRLIAELATAYRVPAVLPFRDDMEHGALMVFGTNLTLLGRQLAGQVAKILQGVKPGDIPTEQASRFVFGINLKTAGAMDFTFPPAAIARADEVIE